MVITLVFNTPFYLMEYDYLASGNNGTEEVITHTSQGQRLLHAVTWGNRRVGDCTRQEKAWPTVFPVAFDGWNWQGQVDVLSQNQRFQQCQRLGATGIIPKCLGLALGNFSESTRWTLYEIVNSRRERCMVGQLERFSPGRGFILFDNNQLIL